MELNSSLKVGNFLKHLLIINKKTQEDFADEIFVDVRTVRRYLKDGINNLEVISRIALYFNMSYIQFLIESEKYSEMK